MPHARPPRVLPLEPGDAGELLTLQRAAYATEGQIYGDPFIAPLTQTLRELERELLGAVALKVLAGTRMVGAVRAHVDGPTAHIGRLMVAPDLQGQGIGTLLLRAIEDTLAARVERFELFTGDRNPGNMRLYLRLGYTRRRNEAVAGGLTLVHLDKPVSRDTTERAVPVHAMPSPAAARLDTPGRRLPISMAHTLRTPTDDEGKPRR